MQIYGHTTPSIVALAARLEDAPCRIRWGGGFVDDAFNGTCTFRNGLQQLQSFRSNDIPTVEFTFDRAIAQQWVQTGSIVLGRRLNHTQGRDIVIPGHRHWPYRDYWTKYQPAAEEWRFHIFEGRSIGRGKKVLISSGNNVQHDPIIRSRRRGWHMEHETNPPKGIRTLAKNAVKAVGYDFGAVDIIRLEDNSFRVLEVNSRPAIRDEYTLAAYEEAIRREIIDV